MMYNDKHMIVKRAIDQYGEKHQMTVAIEELSELQKEICKFIRKDRRAWDVDRLVEEMADVRLMMFQLQIIFGIETKELQVMEDIKLKRLWERMQENDLI